MRIVFALYFGECKNEEISVNFGKFDRIMTGLNMLTNKGNIAFLVKLSNFCYKAGNRGKKLNKRNWVTLGYILNEALMYYQEVPYGSCGSYQIRDHRCNGDHS